MPFSFDRAKERLEKQPDFIGEEGILHILDRPLPDTKEARSTVPPGSAEVARRYYLKQWYGMGEKGVATLIENGRSPSSPYWAKLKYWEYKIIHSLFPDNTLHLVAAIDPRIKKDATSPSGHSFDFNSPDLPLTASFEVVGDKEKERVRDGIIRPAYDRMIAYRRRRLCGLPLEPGEREGFFRLVMETDERIREEFGQELGGMQPEPGSQQPLPFDLVLARAKSAYPDSAITHMMEYGVAPIHPEFNFIPQTRPADEKHPHGTFIELMIGDHDRLLKKAAQIFSNNKDGEKKYGNLEAQVYHYVLYLYLDCLFDLLSRHDPDSPASRLPTPKEQDTLFQLTEALRRIFYAKGATDPLAREKALYIAQIVFEALKEFVRSNPDENKFCETMEKIRQKISPLA